MWSDVSVDRLTLVGHYTNAIHAYIRREICTDDVSIGKRLYRYSFKPWFGGLVEVNPSSEGGQVRYDFNPNELRSTLDAIRFIRWMRDGELKTVRPTRIDVAIDYHDYEHLPSANWVDDLGRKSCVYRGRLGQLESIYFGSASSKRRIRIYDKALEQKEEGNWWRVEVQMRLLPEDDWEEVMWQPFEGVYAYHTNVSGLSVQELAMLEYLERYPDASSRLDKKTRAKYRRLRRQVGVISPVPADLWDSERQHIYDVLGGWIDGPELLHDEFGETYFGAWN